MSPSTIQRRTTKNLKTKNNQNCQKIKLYGCLTTKELKKKPSSRLVGRVETGSWVERTCGKAVAGRLGSPTFASGKTGRNNWGARQTVQLRVPACGNKASKPLAVKTCGGCGSGRNSQPHRRVHWRDPQGPRTYTNSSTQESASEGPICLCVAEEVTESLQRAEQVELFPLRLLPYIQHHNTATFALPWWISKAPFLTM